MKEVLSPTVVHNFDDHLHVSAGPGAGKTHWLVGHLKTIQHNSPRLGPSAKIACISYTNTAANQMKEALGVSADGVEIGTIHSFLFANVVRPYVHLLKGPDGQQLVNASILDGHFEHRPSYARVADWLRSVGRIQLSKFDWRKVSGFLQRVSWRLSAETGEWVLRPNRAQSPGKYFPVTKLDNYKHFYWRDGIIDHDDVLYLAYRVLAEHPLITMFLSRRFPYLLVDEFQDTSPVQSSIVQWMARKGTTVTVVGDAEQSIFSFQGASVEAFLNFELPGQKKLTILGNRRSTSAIVKFLNIARRDGLAQHSLRQSPGEPVQVIVGELDAIVTTVTASIGEAGTPNEFAILARSNSEVSRLRSDPSFDIEKCWDHLVDADHVRTRFLRSCCEAATLIGEGQISAALTELRGAVRVSDRKLSDPFRFEGELEQRDRDLIAAMIAKFLSQANRDMQSSSLLDIYNGMSLSLGLIKPGLSLARVKGGKFANAAQQVSYGSLVANESPNSSCYTSTIHKAKGMQFTNVLVCFSESFSLKCALDAKRVSEEQRVAYVGLSRAKDRLFIGTPELDSKDEKLLQLIGCIVRRIPQQRRNG